ncbi:MAG TPA: helix-turn-helix transcriptional regulator [Acidobacteriaceae bacterium]|jgi:transcriptional regulator with XRE-family HTH domain|nr:helix-turn-helix transcriptional regulator [Acidobacteriaceae bacterium]
MPPRRTGTPPREVVAFGERVRHLRLERGWTQERLAEAAGLNAVQVSHIENGLNEPKLTTVLRIARAFKIGAGELLRPVL